MDDHVKDANEAPTAKAIRVEIGKVAPDTRIFVDNVDISRLVSRFTIESDARDGHGGLTKLTLESTYGAHGELLAALDRDQIAVVEPTR